MLILLGLPIGNLADASPNAVTVLNRADVIAAEDTRKYFRIASELGIGKRAKVISYHDSTEVDRSEELISYLKQGLTVVVLTDAGMPTISDPGYRIVNAAVAAGIKVTTVPGPSAVTAALAVSGLPTDRFCFEGFLPRKAGERAQHLTELASERRTMVFFEAPHRLHESLIAMREVFGENRKAVICRELTKTYEEIVRGTLSELVEWANKDVLGEVTLVVAGIGDEPVLDLSNPDHQEQIKQLVANHPLAVSDRKQAVAAVAKSLNLPKREVYDLVMKTGKA
ncbi:MAG: 16S rRNA (cytidine(1402)-2'-O)-methyltransferase [Candidatus Nanopelagicales bacterium]